MDPYEGSKLKQKKFEIKLKAKAISRSKCLTDCHMSRVSESTHKEEYDKFIVNFRMKENIEKKNRAAYRSSF